MMTICDAPRLKRGTLSPCGKFRFWQYQAGLKLDGTKGEHWISTNRYEAKKIHTNQLQEIARARRDWNEMMKARRAK